MTTEDELVAALAEKVAALVDTTAKLGDGSGMLRAVNTLRDLMDTLPIRETRGEVTPGDGPADRRAELVQLFASGPTVGDAADA
jgi:hypothetical protein